MASKTTEKKEKKLNFYSKKKKEEFIKEKQEELTELFRDLTEDKKVVINQLIDELSFMYSELKELKEIIKRDGTREKYQNGKNQYGIKKSAAAENYIAIVKNYAAISKQLTDYLPKNEVTKPDEFEKFLNE